MDEAVFQVIVTIAGLSGAADLVKCSRDVRIKPDVALDEVSSKKFDSVILPGECVKSTALKRGENIGNQSLNNALPPQ